MTRQIDHSGVRTKMVKLLLKYIKGKILDCGSSYGGIWKENKNNITYLDITNQNLPNFVQHNLNKLPLPFRNNEFDTILCSHVLEHTEIPYRIIKEMKRILKKDGNLIIAMPNPHMIFSGQLKTEDHINLICQKTMEIMLTKLGFEIINIKHNWLFVESELFGKLCEFLPNFLKTDYWIVAKKNIPIKKVG